MLRKAGNTITFFVCFVLSACSQLQPHSEEKAVSMPVQAVDDSAGNLWWRICFRMPFDDEGQPRWAMDVLLADQVVGPVIGEHTGDIALWRFHRRAAPDAAGHQFSVWFYTGSGVRESISEEVADNTLLAKLISDNLVEKVMIDCGSLDDRSAIAATSDPSWNEKLQKSWPYFMMGASLNWLVLIHETAGEMPGPGDDPKAMLEYYQEVDDRMTRLWQLEGNHAYLHHLSALFGYRSLLIRF